MDFEIPTEPGITAGGPEEMDDEPGFRLLPYDSDSDLTDEAASEDSDDKTDAQKKEAKKEKKRRRREKRMKKEKERKEKDKEPVKLPKVARTKEWAVDTAKIKLRIFEGAEACMGTCVVEGFPSKGLTSTLVAKHLVSELNLPLVGEVSSDAFPPMCRVTARFPGLPVRVYGDKRISVFLAEMQPHGVLAHAMADVVFYWAEQYKAPLILTAESFAKEIKLKDDVEVNEENILELLAKGMEESDKSKKKKAEKAEKRKGNATAKHPATHKKPGMPGSKVKIGSKGKAKDHTSKAKAQDDDDGQSSEGWEDVDEDEDEDAPGDDNDDSDSDSDVEDNDAVMFFTTDQRVSTYLRQAGLRQVREALVNGTTGVIMAEARCHHIPALCLIGRYNPMLTDTRSSVEIVRTIVDLLNTSPGCQNKLEIDFDHLESKASKVEGKMRRSVKQVTKAAVSKKKAPGMMYM